MIAILLMRPETLQNADGLRQPSGSRPFSTVVVHVLSWINNFAQTITRTVIQNQHFAYYSQLKTVHP
ncbi:hypothetical protein, partial [Frankia sp. CiP1_Cm_nod1]|uniref:hypothetical protein n=1 Tax=Frankia sp. CiP1_Cm_nod1 TaxID=2897160 RepID=UPI002024C412